MISKIRNYRTKQNMTMSDLSSKAGIAVGHLCDIEHGIAPVTAKTAKKLAAVMGLKNWWTLVTELPNAPKKGGK